MSNFNGSLNAGSLLETLTDSNMSREDLYICDREAYMVGRRGDTEVKCLTERELDMYAMGQSAYLELGAPA